MFRTKLPRIQVVLTIFLWVTIFFLLLNLNKYKNIIYNSKNKIELDQTQKDYIAYWNLLCARASHPKHERTFDEYLTCLNQSSTRDSLLKLNGILSTFLLIILNYLRIEIK